MLRKKRKSSRLDIGDFLSPVQKQKRMILSYVFRSKLCANWNHPFTQLLARAAIIAQKHENLFLNGLSSLQSAVCFMSSGIPSDRLVVEAVDRPDQPLHSERVEDGRLPGTEKRRN
jgi:hypothetical protein